MTLSRFPQALLIGLALSLGGCAKTQTTIAPPPPRPNPPPQMASDPVLRMQTLGRLADTYARTSNQLPGESTTQHRQLMAQVFAQLQEILPLLEGPNPGAEFRQQLQVVRDAQAELATGPDVLSPEPTIDTGLRAARDTLSSIAQGGFYDQSSLTPLFDQFTAKINQLDTVRGPLHQVVAGDAVAISSQIISKMADAMTHRLADQSAAPSTSPTSAPSSEPSSATQTDAK